MNRRLRQWLITGIILAGTLGLFACGSTGKRSHEPVTPTIREESPTPENKTPNKTSPPTFNDLRGYLLPARR